MDMSSIFRTLHEQAGFRIFTGTYAAGSRFGPHVDGRPRISVVLRGQLREESGGRQVEAASAALVVKPADAVHRNRFGDVPVHLLTIEFNPETPMYTEACFSSWRWMQGVGSARIIADLMHGLRTATTLADHQGTVVDLLAGLAPMRERKQAPPAWLRRIHERIRDEHPQRLRTSELAAGAGVHPVYLARRYRQSYGCSIGEDLTRRRIERSIPTVVEGREELVHVALEHGFADQSHFQRQFRSAVGMPPGRFRRLCHHFR